MQRAGGTFNDLVQVHTVIEALQARYGIRANPRDAQSRGHLDLGDRDARAGQRIQAIRGVLEFDRGVAQVEARAEMAVQRRIGCRHLEPGKRGKPRGRAARVEMIAEKSYGLGDGFEQAAWLWLERKNNGASGLSFDAQQMGDVPNQQVRNLANGVRRFRIGLECPGHRADAAQVFAIGQQCRQQISQQIGVLEPFFLAPVGQVDAFLHARAVEGPVGKAVYREDVEIVPAKKVDELRKRLGRAQ